MPTSRGMQALEPGHLEALKAKHADLSARIEREQLSLATSDEELHYLKREKLRLKDEILREELGDT